MGGVSIELEGCNSQSKRECMTGNLLAENEQQQQQHSSNSNNSSMSAAGTSTRNATGTSRPTNDPISQMMQGLHFMQNELLSVRQDQEEAARV